MQMMKEWKAVEISRAKQGEETGEKGGGNKEKHEHDGGAKRGEEQRGEERREQERREGCPTKSVRPERATNMASAFVCV